MIRPSEPINEGITLDELLRTDQVIDAVDILTHVSTSLRYLENDSNNGLSSILTLLAAEVDRAIETLAIPIN